MKPDRINELFTAHGRGVLFFSAGKDSRALLELLRPNWHRLDVVWVAPGKVEEEVADYMNDTATLVPYFFRVRGDREAHVATHGWPVDVLPVQATTLGQIGAGPAPIKFQSYVDCCSANLWKPMEDWLRARARTLVFMGQRHDEKLRNYLRDKELAVVNDWTFAQPLHSWSAQDVNDFLSSRSIPLPPFYAEGSKASTDCLKCTAYTEHLGDRLPRLRRKDPDGHAEVVEVLTDLHARLDVERLRIQHSLSLSEET